MSGIADLEFITQSVQTVVAGRKMAAYGYVPVFTVLGGLHLTAFAALSWGFRAEARKPVPA